MNFLKSKVNGLWSKSDDAAKDEHHDIPQSLTVENPDGVKGDAKGEEYNKEERSSLWKALSGKLGMDVTVGVSLPVWLCEPCTTLTRMGEMLHFADLLNEAADCENSLDRLAYVAVFAVTGYNGTERFGKPFNPVLGETFEFVDDVNKFRFISEQVSHHPPVSASHAEGDNFVFYQETRPKTKFHGNSLELETQGKTHIYFPRTRDHYVFINPTTKVNNIIIGSMWIEHVGNMTITNLKNGDSCTITFEKSGWLGRGRNELNGSVKDSNGVVCLQISGKWNESVNVKWIYEDGKEPKDTIKTLWKRPSNNSIGKHKLTEFVIKLNEMSDDYFKLLPSTDSRLRPDRKALEKGDMGEAAIMKQKVEERQRQDRRRRDAKGEDWIPRFFKQIPEETNSPTPSQIWVYCGDYWEQRGKNKDLLALESHNEAVKSDDGEKDDNTGITGFACDFRSYH